MSAKSDLAARSKAVSQGVKSDKPAAVTPLDKKVRLSADIAPEAYRALVSWCQDVALAVGRTRVQHVWALRALVDELRENPDLQVRIIERIRDEHLDY